MGFENLSIAFYEYPAMIHDIIQHMTELQVRQIPKLPITGNWQHDDAYVEPQVLSYEGPFGVGYMVARFGPSPVPEAGEAAAT